MKILIKYLIIIALISTSFLKFNGVRATNKSIITYKQKNNINIIKSINTTTSCEFVLQADGFSYDFPTCTPSKIEVGKKIISSNLIDWQDVYATPVPTLEIGENDNWLFKITNKFQYNTLQARFNCPLSGQQFFDEVLNQEIDFTSIDDLTKEMDEQALWSKYVNWLATKAPNIVQKNSGKVYITLEVWNLLNSGKLINDNCSLQSLPSEKEGLLYRYSQKEKTFLITDIKKSIDYGLFLSNYSSYGNYYVRVKHCYVFSLFDTQYSRYTKKMVCSKWSRANYEPSPLPSAYMPSSPNTIVKSYNTEDVRIRISRPRSYAIDRPGIFNPNDIPENQKDGDPLKNCMNYEHRYYYPPLNDANPDNFTPPTDSGIVYAKRIINGNTEQSVFIKATLFRDLFLKPQKCGKRSTENTSDPTAEYFTKKINNQYFTEYLNEYIVTSKEGKIKHCATFKRNGIEMTFKEGEFYADILVPEYRIYPSGSTSTSGFGVYPRYKNTQGVYEQQRMFYRPLPVAPFFDFWKQCLYVPLKQLATGLGATMAYNTWEENTRSDSIVNNMVGTKYFQKGKVNALIWDQRWRTTSNTNGKLLIEDDENSDPQIIGINRSQHDIVPMNSEYLSLEYNDIYASDIIYSEEPRKDIENSIIRGLPGYGRLVQIRDEASNFLISPSFTFRDIACGGSKATHKEMVPNYTIEINTPIMSKMDNARIFCSVKPWGGIPSAMQQVKNVLSIEKINIPLRVCNQFRCPECNVLSRSTEVFSFHTFGRAVDISTSRSNCSVEEDNVVYKAVASILLDCPYDNVAFNSAGIPIDNRPGSQINIDRVGNYYVPSDQNGYPVAHYCYELGGETIPNPRKKYREESDGWYQQGSIVGIECMPFEGDYWAHINVFPPPLRGWGDGIGNSANGKIYEGPGVCP